MATRKKNPSQVWLEYSIVSKAAVILFALGLLIVITLFGGGFELESIPRDESEIPRKSPDFPPREITSYGIVSEVIDGDTIKLVGGKVIRYLGIDTPEKGIFLSVEATTANQNLVAGQEVGIELDTQTKDQYGRTLAYVWIGETMVNLELVRQGLANVYFVPPNIKYTEQFLTAEREARQAKRGLWVLDF